MQHPADHARSSIADQAAALVAEVQRTLAEGDERLRALGLNPDKVRAMAARLSPEQQQQAEAAAKQDLEAVETEVAQERARLQAQVAPAAGGQRKPRRFI